MKKNTIKRLIFKKLEKNNRILKILYNNTLLTKKKRTAFAQKRHQLKAKSGISIIRTTCTETYRNRAIITIPYKLSRLCFKKYVSEGFITGIRKV